MLQNWQTRKMEQKQTNGAEAKHWMEANNFPFWNVLGIGNGAAQLGNGPVQAGNGAAQMGNWTAQFRKRASGMGILGLRRCS